MRIAPRSGINNPTFYFLNYLSRTQCGGRPTFLTWTEREYGGRRDRREIKLETSNISPLGAVAILRAISIRDVVIENERALSSLCLSRALENVGVRKRTWIFFRFFFLLQRFVPPESRARAYWKLKRWLSNFLFRAAPTISAISRLGVEKGWGERESTERIDKISHTFNWSVCEKYENFSMTTTAFVNISRWRKNRLHDRGYQIKKIMHAVIRNVLCYLLNY